MDSHTNRLCALRRAAWLLAVATAAVVLLAPTAARAAEAEKAKATEPAPAKGEEAKGVPPLSGENAQIAKEVGLSTKQKQQFAAIVAEANDAMAKWHQDHSAQLQAANQALSAAQQAQDRAAFQQALVNAQPLMKERRALQLSFENRIQDMLTPKQEGKWVGYALYRQMIHQAEGLQLTGEQKQATRTVCDDTGKSLAALPDTEKATEADRKKALEIQRTLVEKFMNEVLTEAQRAKVQPVGPGTPPTAPATPTTPAPPVQPKEKAEAKPVG